MMTMYSCCEFYTDFPSLRSASCLISCQLTQKDLSFWPLDRLRPVDEGSVTTIDGTVALWIRPLISCRCKSSPTSSLTRTYMEAMKHCITGLTLYSTLTYSTLSKRKTASHFRLLVLEHYYILFRSVLHASSVHLSGPFKDLLSFLNSSSKSEWNFSLCGLPHSFLETGCLMIQVSLLIFLWLLRQ